MSQRPVIPIALANPTPALPFTGPGPAVPAARTSAGKIVALGVACALVVGVSTFLIVSAHKRHAALPSSVPADAGITRSDGTAVAPVILPAATIDAGGLTDVRDAAASAPVDAGTVRSIDAGVNQSHTHTSPPNHTSIHRGSDALPSAGSAAHNGSGKKFDPDAVED